MISGSLNSVPPGMRIFMLRLLAAIGSSVIFGLVATSDRREASLLLSVLAGFLFGTAFVGGTGYRILISVWVSKRLVSPASWSGAAAASAIACIIAVLVWPRTIDEAAKVILGYALAINFAYLAVKASCTLAGCCHADIKLLGCAWGLRQFEIGATVTILIVAAALSLVDVWLGALIGMLGHTLLRLYSRGMRGRWSTGWPPFRQPGAELAPLQLLTVIAGGGALI